MNVRVVLTGIAMVAMALAFFFGMSAYMAPKSNNPTSMMQTVGMTSGAVGGIGIVMIVIGALRRKR
jgi:hypothetical protein